MVGIVISSETVFFRFDTVFEQPECRGECGLFQIRGYGSGKSVFRNADAGVHLKGVFAKFLDMTEVGTAACQYETCVELVSISGIFDLLFDGVEDFLLNTAVDDLGKVVLVDLTKWKTEK